MKNKRIYQICILILVLLNLGTLLFFWVNRPENRNSRPPDVSAFLIKELGLTDNQQKEYLLLRDEHRASMKGLSEHDKQLHNLFFDLVLKEPADSPGIVALADSIVANRKKMELVTYDHFYRINKMLNPDQQQKFTSIFHEVIRMIVPPQPLHGPRPTRNSAGGPPPPGGPGEGPPPPPGQ